MKNQLEFIKVVNDFIAPLLEGKLAGEIFLIQKPDKYRNKEFVVVNALTTPNRTLQVVTVNVNIHVGDFQPGMVDTLRMSELTNLILDEISEEGYTNDDYTINCLDNSFERNEVAKESYSNIRLRISLINE